MSTDLFRKVGFFGGCWFSFMLFVSAVFFAPQWIATKIQLNNSFSEYWRWDIVGIMLIATCLISIAIAGRTTAMKATFLKLWNFGFLWVFTMFVASFVIFAYKEAAFRSNPSYTFIAPISWDTVGITALITCAISLYLVWFKKNHAKKQ